MVVGRNWSGGDANGDRDFLGWNGFSAIWVSSPDSNLEHSQFNNFHIEEIVDRYLNRVESMSVALSYEKATTVAVIKMAKRVAGGE
ncbi:hypothetical protein OROHE_014606 [Orobanche hederae]